MGVDVEMLKEGTGPYPTKGQTCVMNYIGKFTDGKEFDSSYKRNRPFRFKLGAGEVIKGWDVGVAQIRKGGKALLTITPDFGYGSSGIDGIIPPNATLKFEVELLSIE